MPIDCAIATVQALVAQTPTVQDLDEKVLREYSGTYQWDARTYVYLQLWSELNGKNQLVAFDELGEVRTLYPMTRDHFFAGPGAAVSSSIESRIDFQRDAQGRIVAISWHRDGAPSRTAHAVDIERRDDVAFSNSDIHLAGTLISPRSGGKHPAIIVVHAPPVLRTASISSRSHTFLSGTASLCLSTISVASASQPATGRPRYSTTLRATSSPRSTT